MATQPVRIFKVEKPVMTGPDIKAWKATVIKLFKNMNIDAPIDDNDLYNTNTRNVSMALTRAVGLDPKVVFKNGLGPAERSKIKTAATKKPDAATVEFRAELKKKWAPKSPKTPAAKTPATKPAAPKPTKPAETKPKVPAKVTPPKSATKPKAPAKTPAVKPKPKPAPKVTTLNGIDVSSAQSPTVTKDVKCDFAIIKATEGLRYINPNMLQQIKNARATGKLLGLYHFADTNLAALEVQHFYQVVKPYIGSAIMILDFEGPALNNGPAWALQFLNQFKIVSGVDALIYGSRGNICNNGYAAVAAKYGLYVAAYPSPTPTEFAPETEHGAITPWTEAKLYQYSNVGKLPGYSGNLDLDVFYGDKDAWKVLQVTKK